MQFTQSYLEQWLQKFVKLDLDKEDCDFIALYAK